MSKETNKLANVIIKQSNSKMKWDKKYKKALDKAYTSLGNTNEKTK